MSLSYLQFHRKTGHRGMPTAWVILLGLLAVLGLGLPASAENVAPTTEPGQLTAIDVDGHIVRISATASVKHVVMPTADPFKVLIALEKVSATKFSAPIRPERSVVSEILVKQGEGATATTLIAFSLASPSQVHVREQGNVLEVSFDEIAQTQPSSSANGQPMQKTATSAPAGAAREIREVMLDKTDLGAELIIKTDSRITAPTISDVGGVLYIDVPVSVMKGSVPAKMIAPVRAMKYRVENDRIRFIIEPSVPIEAQATILDDELIVDIKPVAATRKKAVTSDETQQLSPEVRKKTVSLDFQDADIVPIFRLLSDVSGHNIVVHPEVKGRITMKLVNAPWEKALDYILKTFSLEQLVDGNTIRVMTSKAYQDERKAVADSKEQAGRAEEIETKVYVINYANVDTVKGKDQKPDVPGLKEIIEKGKVLSPRGSISVNTRTRSLIVKDIPSVHDELQKLIAVLDKPTPQVLIEARIVEVNTSFAKSIGVDWGLTGTPRFGANNWTATGGIDTLLPGARTYLNSVGGSPVPPGRYQAPLNDSTTNYYHPTGVNLPATTTNIVSPTSALTLGFLNASQTFGIDLRLSAIETAGKGKLLASPKILTFENEQALIRYGKKIPITTPGTTQGTFTTTYIDANLKLTVTPQIAPDSTVSMLVEVNKDEPDYLNKDILGNPAIDTRQVQTQVQIRDGETLVIGGIIKTSEGDDDSSVPGLSKIPLLGLLFKRTTKETSSQEMLVFITPRIVKRP